MATTETFEQRIARQQAERIANYEGRDTEGSCCVRCANPQHRDLFDRLGIGHNDH